MSDGSPKHKEEKLRFDSVPTIMHHSEEIVIPCGTEPVPVIREWIRVIDGVPNDGEIVDVWTGDIRIPSVKFKDNMFQELMLDFEGDAEYYMPLKGITHWIRIIRPKIN